MRKKTAKYMYTGHLYFREMYKLFFTISRGTEAMTSGMEAFIRLQQLHLDSCHEFTQTLVKGLWSFQALYLGLGKKQENIIDYKLIFLTLKKQKSDKSRRNILPSCYLNDKILTGMILSSVHISCKCEFYMNVDVTNLQQIICIS